MNTSLTSACIKALGLFLLLGFTACQTTRQREAASITPTTSWDLFEGSHIGEVERVIPQANLAVIALRIDKKSSVREGTRLEIRTLQNQQTSILEVTPNPSSRFVTAKILEGHPEIGNSVLRAPSR